MVFPMDIEKMRRELEHIGLVADLSPEKASDLYAEALEALRSADLVPSKRAEGHAIFPFDGPPPLSIPHVRLAMRETRVMLWVRSPHELSEELAERVESTAEELYRKMLAGARRVAEVFQRYKGHGSVHVSLPPVSEGTQ